MIIFSLIFLLLSACINLTAEPVTIPDLQATVDLPIGLNPVEIARAKATFTTSDSSLYFQIKTYPGEQFDSAQALFDSVKNELGATGEGSPYLFNKKEAIFANLNFQKGDFAFSGYFVFINNTTLDMVLFSFTENSELDKLSQFILSSLDSFQDNTLPPAPGPVSQFILVPGAEQKAEVILANKKLAFTFDKNQPDIANDTIKREYSILTAYAKSPDWDKAWQRFYRMLFNDNFAGLRPLAEALKKQKEITSLEPRDQATLILKWLQSVPFTQAEPFTDFTDPLTVITSRNGDCDSKGLIFVILTHYLGIDSILLVSPVYKHALAGVDVKGKGARFPFNNKQYLIAELNEKVELGLIAADMAEPSNWLAITFD